MRLLLKRRASLTVCVAYSAGGSTMTTPARQSLEPKPFGVSTFGMSGPDWNYDLG